MDIGRRLRTRWNADSWSELIGLSTFASRVAMVTTVVTLILDETFQVAGTVFYGVGRLDGAGNFLSWWDLLKVVVTAAALLYVAWRYRSASFGGFTIVYFLVAAEDQLGLHHAAGRRVGRLLARTWEGGWIAAHDRQIGTLVVMTAFAVAGFLLIWVWERPQDARVRRAQIVLTALLVVLFGLAGGLNFVDTVLNSRLLPALEETGERVVMTLSLGYTLGLASMRRRDPDGGTKALGVPGS